MTAKGVDFMCGITGWIDWNEDLSQQRFTMEKMANTLIPRGPDESGVWLSTHAALANRRLIVIDPVGGDQPMTRQRGDTTFTLVYNGELYNTAEIRRELETRGHRFTSHSDTEVVLLSFMEWGYACLEHFNGIFAFAVWNATEQSLFVARDRLGVKPLFYHENNSVLLFGSEIKTLLAHPSVHPRMDEEGLAEIFFMGPSRTPGNGVFQGIKELKPGHHMVFDRNGSRIHSYWYLKSQPHEDDLQTTVLKVRELLQDAVERQLISDVPIGTLLSGGLDSSAITAFAALYFKEKGMGSLDTFNVDYLDNARNFQKNEFQPTADAPWVEKVAQFFHTHHHSILIDTPELVEAVKSVVTARDLPGQVDIDASLYLFCREIKKENTVVLSGECADEIFGGYPWFHKEDALHTDTFPWLRKTKERAKLLSPEWVHKIKPEAYVADRYQQTIAETPRLQGENPFGNRIRELFYLNIKWFMAQLLDRKDRMSMAASLEARVPFSDHRLVEYVWNIPWEMKTCDGMEKGILRRALKGVLPADVLTRKKSPYPKTFHPSYTEAVRNWVIEILEDSTSPLLPLIDINHVRALTKAEHAMMDIPWYGQLMRLPQLFAYLGQVDTWLRKYRVTIG
jgi:asparagine synthase (glutamine-hydrolysing)